jgi:glutathione S-transferase
MRLITIPMSHYCEKARWALERAQIQYTEEAHLQVFHYWAVRSLNTMGMVPVLVDGAQVIADSSEILEHLDQYIAAEKRLYPPKHREEVAALEDYFGEGLGIESRRWVYFHWLKVPTRDVLETAAQMTPRWQKALAPIVFPIFRNYLTRYLSITEENVISGGQTIKDAFERVEEILSDGRPYLVGSQFTAADLTFATMAAPVLLPREYGIRLPTLDEAPDSAKADIQVYRAHPAGKFALKLFEERAR